MKSSRIASFSVVLASALSVSLLITPSFAKVAKPGAPKITKITSGKTYKKSGKSYSDVTVTVAKPTTGGAATSIVVSAAKFSCTASGAVKSCALKQVPLNTYISISAKAKNASGFSSATSAVRYKAGSATWPVPQVATVAGAPTIVSISAANQAVTVNFTAPASDGGAAITNYAFSADNGTTWTTRSPVSTSTPLVVSAVSAGSHQFKIRAINSVGSGAASAAREISVIATVRAMLPIKFRSLIGSRGLVVKHRSNSALHFKTALGIKFAISDVLDSTEVQSVDDFGNVQPAVESQTGPMNIDRIFIGPGGRTIATLGSNDANCSVAEIDPASGDTFCIATRAQASLTNVELRAQQLSGFIPVKIDSFDNVFINSFNSLIEVTPDGELSTLVSDSDGYCIQGWAPLNGSGIVAWVNIQGIGCGGDYLSFHISSSAGQVTKTQLCSCGLMSIAPTADGGAILGDFTYNLSQFDPTTDTMTPIDFTYSSTINYHLFAQSKVLSDGRVIAIPQNYWGQIQSRQATPLMQYQPQLDQPLNTFSVENVPVPFLLAKMSGGKVAVAGLADPVNCFRYAAIWKGDPCAQEARLSVYDLDTRTDTPIDLVNADGGNTDPMDIYFLSGSPDGTHVLFAGARSTDGFATMTDVIGSYDTATGQTKITPVSGFLGLSAY